MRTCAPTRSARAGRAAPSALALVAVLVLPACGGGADTTSTSARSDVADAPTSSPTTAPPAGSTPTADVTTAAPAAPPDALPGFATPSGWLEQAPSGDPMSVTAVRVARQDGYDRVVFELGGGSGQPGWRIRYDDQPTQPGSGNRVDVAGDAVLAVLVEGVGYPFDTGVEEYSGPRSLRPGDTSVVREVRVGAVFEGQYDAFVGVTAERPIRVLRLDGPPRVVIDVQH